MLGCCGRPSRAAKQEVTLTSGQPTTEVSGCHNGILSRLWQRERWKPSAEAEEWALLQPSERPDLKMSLKLGLDPSLPIISKVYAFEEVLGRGAFGEVVLARSTQSERKYAIKKLETSTLRSGDLRNEINILKECRHPNIISLIACYATEEYVYLVMELAHAGALFDVVLESGHLSEAFAAAATMQIASALAYMHKRGVVQCVRCSRPCDPWSSRPLL